MHQLSAKKTPKPILSLLKPYVNQIMPE
uniref:Uncharacterized protein n=1 Tax=Rhizophora mucronata TaxID=61149 RepID=A0A2P2PEX2_RHIMU